MDTIPLNEFESTDSQEPDPLTWGATPLQVYGRSDIAAQQTKVYSAIEQRTFESLSDDLPQELQDFIFVSVAQRFYDESMRNHESYEARLNRSLESLSIEDLGAYEQAKTGHASPESLLRTRRQIGLRSIELGKVSHPNGSHIADLVPMRHAIVRAIEANGGMVNPEDDSFCKLKIRSGDMLAARSEDHQPLGVAMTRKRWVGTLDDDTRIYERSNFVVRLDQGSELSPEILTHLRAIKIVNNLTWPEEYFAVDGFKEAVFDALHNDNYAIAIPLSTMAFAFNLATQQEIEKRQAVERAQRTRSPAEVRLRELARAILSPSSTEISSSKNDL